MRSVLRLSLVLFALCVTFAVVQPVLANAPPTEAPNAGFPVFTETFSSNGSGYSLTIVGGTPQSGGTTTIPTAILPVSFIFDEYLDANGNKMVLDATSIVPTVVQSPIFQTYAFSTGTTQYGDAVQRANFWNTMRSDWHTLLGQPTILPTLQIEVTPGHSYVMQSKTTGGTFAVIDIVLMQNAVSPAIKNDYTAGQLPIVLFRNVAFFGSLVPSLAQWAEDPTVCCSFGQHGIITSNYQPFAPSFIEASYLDPGLLPQSADGMTIQGEAGLPILTDIQAISEQVVQWLNDPLSDPYTIGTGSSGFGDGNVFPAWSYPEAPAYSLGGEQIGDEFFSGEPTDGLLPRQQTTAITMNGFIYHVSNVALLPWYEQDGVSNAYNGAYSYPDTLTLAEASKYGFADPFQLPSATPAPQSPPNGHLLIGLWINYDWIDPLGFIRLVDVAPQYDVIKVLLAPQSKTLRLQSISLCLRNRPPKNSKQISKRSRARGKRF